MGRGLQTKHSKATLRSPELLSREQFRQRVFERDGHLCVICGAEAVDAHHLIERRLWTDNGLYLNNGVSLCEIHHLEAEATTLSCQELRDAAEINSVLLPPDFDPEENYDKWGDIILDNGRRSPGPLFDDPSVQKILAQGRVLDLYTPYIKQPRTPHLSFSAGVSADDILLKNDAAFIGQEIIISDKLDGESASIYSDGYCHARSLDSGYHPSRTRLKALAAELGPQLPRGWRICGENMVAQHSIAYHDIPHFLVYSIWNEHNQCLSWPETLEWAELLGLTTVPELYAGPWDEDVVRCCWQQEPGIYSEENEGFVVRKAEGFTYREFGNSVAKFVRPGHITDDRHHWTAKPMIENGLSG